MTDTKSTPVEKTPEKPVEKAPKKLEIPAKNKESKPEKVKKDKEYNPWKILKFPHLAEKSMNMVELENKLVFIVDRRATRAEIKNAIQKGFGVKVLKVNMEITRRGEKKAFIRLSPEHTASDIASRLGMI